MQTRLSILALAAAATLGLAACGERTTSPDTGAGPVSQAPMQERNAPVGTARSAVNDATITAAVNAELARDNELSSLRIDVDTSEGKVALKGTAPNAGARDRATQIAQAVEGVKSVDNQLTIRGG